MLVPRCKWSSVAAIHTKILKPIKKITLTPIMLKKMFSLVKAELKVEHFTSCR